MKKYRRYRIKWYLVMNTELEKLQTRVGLLEKQADDKTEEVKRLKEGTKVMKSKLACYLRFSCNRDERQKKTVDELTKSLNEKTESMESLEELTKVLTVKELSLNDELQQARKLLIRYHWGEENGELDSKAFGSALKRHLFPNYMSFCVQELIDEEDKLLKGLKNEWGERAYFAVVNALVEMNKYNPSGRNPVQELWNFKENRRATVMEGVAVLVGRLKKIPNSNSYCYYEYFQEVILITALKSFFFFFLFVLFVYGGAGLVS
ncbi:hypothetical protein MKW92_004783 [Papaver armeniacum]|nr:hypothetical protein MKW92_004783 [Papaver armeniacum]